LTRSEKDEGFLDVTFNALDLLSNNVEADGFGEGTTLTDGHDITHLQSEGGGAMSGDGLVSLFESVVLSNVMEVIASHDDVSVHAGRDNDTPNNYKYIKVRWLPLFFLNSFDGDIHPTKAAR